MAKVLTQTGATGGGGTTTTTMMTTKSGQPTFANLDVRELFETQSVEVTKETKRRVKQEIERKREELRVLVGERYRDLIDAADTIGTMKTGSAQVFTKLTNLRTSLANLPTQLKNTGVTGQQEASDRLNEKELEVAAELKLATTVPRQILLCLEHSDIVGALHLSLLYKEKLSPRWKFYGSLQGSNLGETGDNQSDEIVQSLLNECDLALEDFTTSSENLAECVIVKQILKGCSCEEVIVGFLCKRVELCEKSLESSTSEDFVSKVALSILSLNQIFIDPELYNAAAKKVRKSKIISEKFGFMGSYVPSCILKINSETIPVQEPPRVSVLAEAILRHYIQPLKAILTRENAVSFLDTPASLKEMEQVRSAVSAILKRDTEDLMRIVLGSSTNIWEEVFAPAFIFKCQVVVKSKIETILASLTDSTNKLQGSNLNFDLVSFTWKSGNTSVQTLQTAEVEEGPYLDETVKLKCLTPNVVRLCSAFESDLQTLLSDFLSLTDNPLKEFVSGEISVGLEKFIRENYTQEDTSLFLGRFTGTVSELCPTLWKLLEKNDGVKIRQIILSQSEQCWGDWTQILRKDFERQLEERTTDFSSPVVTTFMPVGEVYKAEGEEFQPSTRVPLQLSHALHTLLFSICLKLSQIGPQSMPKNVRDNLRFAIGESVIHRYQDMITSLENSSEGETIRPQMAIQLVFDLKFIQWFHPKLGGNVEPLGAKLQAVIDPFDWDICNPRLTINLKRFLFENHLTLGLLFSEESHGFIAQNFKTKQNQSFPVSNAFHNIPLLPLLPI